MDPHHPLYRRPFRVIRRVAHGGGNFPPSYEVDHRDGSTLLIAVAATQKYVEDTNQSKLGVEAVRDLGGGDSPEEPRLCRCLRLLGSPREPSS
jgi:hypothetical protein